MLEKEQDLLLKCLKKLAEGVIELKRTPIILSFRTESIFQKINLKQQINQKIQELRLAMLKNKEQPDQVEEIERKNTLKMGLLKEEYYKMRQELKYIKVGQLLFNLSAFLGFDAKDSLYYFFLLEPTKIFVHFKDTYIDDDSEKKWGQNQLFIQFFSYYSKNEQIKQLLQTLNNKGVKENNLRKNIEELLKQKLLILEDEGDANENFEIIASLDKVNEADNFLVLPLSQQLIVLEEKLSSYLIKKNSRWASQKIRQQFQDKILKCSENIEVLIQQCEYFLEHTYSQEKYSLLQNHEIEIRFDQGNEKKSLFFEKQNLLMNSLPIPGLVFEVSQSINDKQETLSSQVNFNNHLISEDHEGVKVERRVPLKIFGYNNEWFRVQMIQTLKLISENRKYQSLLKLILVALNTLITEYVSKNHMELLIKNKSQSYDKKTKQSNYNLRKKLNQEAGNLCNVCLGNEDELTICQNCCNKFHQKCINMKQIPEGTWVCLSCIKNN